MPEEANLSVGDVAKRCGVKVSALHFYENKGLINSYRNSGNQRRYKRDVLRRISLIKAAQKVGVTLEEVKKIFACLPNQRTPTPEDWQILAEYWQVQLDEKIRYMERLREYLTGCIGCGCLSMKSCPIYNHDDELGEKNTGAVLLDLSFKQ